MRIEGKINYLPIMEINAKEVLKIQNEGNYCDLHKETEFVQITETNLFLTLSVKIRNATMFVELSLNVQGLSKGIWQLQVFFTVSMIPADPA